MTRTALLLLAAALPLPALAQAPAPAATAPATAGASVAAGATVYDASGAVVGKVESTDGTNAVVNTGTTKAAIAISSFAAGAKGPVLGLTKAQLDAQAGAQQAQAGAAFKSKLVPGATVYGTGGTQVGTIKSVAGDSVTITTPKGDAALPVGGFGPGPSGVTIGLSAAQLAAQMGAAAPAASAGTGTSAAAGTTSTAGTSATGGTSAMGGMSTDAAGTTTGTAGADTSVSAGTGSTGATAAGSTSADVATAKPAKPVKAKKVRKSKKR